MMGEDDELHRVILEHAALQPLDDRLDFEHADDLRHTHALAPLELAYFLIQYVLYVVLFVVLF